MRPLCLGCVELRATVPSPKDGTIYLLVNVLHHSQRLRVVYIPYFMVNTRYQREMEVKEGKKSEKRGSKQLKELKDPRALSVSRRSAANVGDN